MGLYSAAYKTAVLTAMATGGTIPQVTHIQLHTGSPGPSGTANIAAGSGATRQALTWGTESGGELATTVPPAWSVVAGTYSHVSFWTASTGGTFVASDDLPTPQTYASSATLTLTSVTLDLNAAASAS